MQSGAGPGAGRPLSQRPARREGRPPRVNAKTSRNRPTYPPALAHQRLRPLIAFFGHRPRNIMWSNGMPPAHDSFAAHRDLLRTQLTPPAPPV